MAQSTSCHFIAENPAAELREEDLVDVMTFGGLGYGWILDGVAAKVRPLRDITMMQMIDTITDKPNWMEKIQDPAIRAKWQQEFLTSETDISQSIQIAYVT